VWAVLEARELNEMAIKAIISDCFGVLVFSGHDILVKKYPEYLEQFLKIQEQSDLGLLHRPQYDVQISDITGLSIDVLENKYWKNNQVNYPMLELLAEYRKSGKYKTGLLSNVSREWMGEFLPIFESMQVFDATILSGDVGLIKPYPKIYKLMIDKMGFEPSECLMIDDRAANIEGAKAAGMQGIVFKSFEQAKLDITKSLEENNA